MQTRKKILLTPTLLLDYGLSSQVVFSGRDRSNPFGRKIAIVILNTFATTNNSFVELLIDNKPPKWDESRVILVQYKIVVKVHKFRPSLFET